MVSQASPVIYTPGASIPDELRFKLRSFSPKTDMGRIAKACFSHLPPDLAGELMEAISRSVVVESALSVRTFRTPDSPFRESRTSRVGEYGIVSQKVITTAGVGFLVDAWQNIVELEIMKYHGMGTGALAEAVGDTALGAESTTALNPDSTRATGTTVEGASANIFRSVGTLTVDATAAITEHGLFSTSGTGTGVLWDRSVFSAVNVVSGDSIQFTYDMTATAGG